MNQNQRRLFLIKYLLSEDNEYIKIAIPEDIISQRKLLRSLMNIRQPGVVSDEFLEIQDAYLKCLNEERGIVELSDMEEMLSDIYLWKGDITRISAGAIVNAANSAMTGCYQPCHNCIDNCIHTYAGIQLRNKCAEIMKLQGFPEPTGRAKITPAYNLPCDCVIHTVGPIVTGQLNKEHKDKLSSCYEACLRIASENRLSSIVFCCISTGVFMFPNKDAAEIAFKTVMDFKNKTSDGLKIVFNVFKDEDEIIYRKLLEHKG